MQKKKLNLVHISYNFLMLTVGSVGFVKIVLICGVYKKIFNQFNHVKDITSELQLE